jgi:hypothetical protein
MAIRDEGAVFPGAPCREGEMSGIAETNQSDLELQWICTALLRAHFEQFRHATIHARYYPYIGLTHTIRRRGSTWVIRVSDHCRNAPRAVLESIVLMLACKVTRRRVPSKAVQMYDHYRRSEPVREAVYARRLQRGRKLIGHTEGKHRSLREIFRDLNARYFGGRIEIRKIGWGPRRGWVRLGHYDPVHHTITISPVLDSARVPVSALAFVVYHEMLHAVFDDSPGTDRRRHHTPSFRRAERGYEGYSAAQKFLREFSSSRGRLR